MFEQGSSDPSFRKLLREELEYRTTQRADRLKKRLAAAEEAARNISAPLAGSASPQKFPEKTAVYSSEMEERPAPAEKALAEEATHLPVLSRTKREAGMTVFVSHSGLL